ncbi:hypothetical protein EST38_g12456 [Candolleomyces aberdarensis]|uniref:OTU domain-containing protein n=1 Tax=Candolleomyces aberdarensis TaxID=2316362 RepID=A0A4V1Q204_9AGAR|nr:hypothetical protein EST38_g12456 [Candolleomyces aberdarensis]
MGKTHRKSHPQARTRSTRSHKPRLVLSDPTASSAHLASQLRALGLYPADTLGDGNCLFRALSDQLYGSESRHAFLRGSICDFIHTNKARYEPFCEDERGLGVHLRCMRENGTYGGHLELSAFAHMSKRDVKVVQPGLVYVIEWAAGLDEEEKGKEWRKRRKEEEKEGLPMSEGSVYVAYHDWEHFSSIRNLRGPHAGLPYVVETPVDDDSDYPPPPDRAKEAKKERERERKEKEKAKKITKIKLKLSAPPSSANTPPPGPMTLDDDVLSPENIPLPASRSTSTGPDSLSSLSSLTSSATDNPTPSGSAVHLEAPSSLTPPTSTASTSALPLSMRVHRSPKRSFDESASSEDGASVVSEDVERGRPGRDKRTRIGSVHQVKEVPADEADASAQVEGAGDNEEEVVGSQGREETPATESDGDGEEGGSEGEDDDGEEDEEDEEEERKGAVKAPSIQPSTSTDTATTASTSTTIHPIADDEGYSSLSELSDSPAPPDLPRSPSSGPKRVKQQHVGANGKPLTRRQRKALGLPKHRGASSISSNGSSSSPYAYASPKSAGKITIPGGRFKGRGADAVGAPAGGSNEEWVKNGVGRVDVRGFRELKI